MSTTSVQAKLIKFLEILLGRSSEPLSKTDIVIFVVGATGAGRSTFINTAISENMMAVGHGLESCTDDVESIRCISPWNPEGRSVIFVDTPAFNHSNISIQKKIPRLIQRWLMRTLGYTEGPINSGILYLHSMSPPRINEDFRRHFDPFVKLCHECGHSPSSALVVTTLWPDGESEEKVRERTEDLEEKFRKTATSEIYRISESFRFDGSRLSACEAIDLLTKDILKRTRDTIRPTHSISIPHLRRTVSDSELYSQSPSTDPYTGV